MLCQPRAFLAIILTLLPSAKLSKSVCVNVNKTVTCESVTILSFEVVNEIPGIKEVTLMSIKDSPNLEIDGDALNSTTSLQILIINYNKMESIYYRTFQHLPIEKLYLGYNGISRIYPGAFYNLSRLKDLKLNNNNLEEIFIGLFQNLPISTLTLSKNKFTVIANKALKKLPKLKKLHLDGNKLETLVPHEILSYPQRLQILWLHNNSLTKITNYMLHKLKSLEILNLASNSIFVIEENSFQQTPKLNMLVLSNNHLKEINGNIFPRTGLISFEKLYLDNNKLMYLPSNFFTGLGNLKKITLVGNPWYCACLNELHDILRESKIKERCNEKYTDGSRPICVNDKLGADCKHVYNSNLSEKFENYKKLYPVYITPLSCYL